MLRSLIAPLAALALCLSSTLASAQVVSTEPPDLTGQNLGALAVGTNTISGSLSAFISGFVVAGDTFDPFTVSVPAGLRVTGMEMSISSFFNSGALAIQPGVQIVGFGPGEYVFCPPMNGTHILTIPAPGTLIGGTSYTFSMFTGLSPATNVDGNSRSFSYVLRLIVTQETGACCNRWTGNCAVMTQPACTAVGLRYDGFASTCSPATCTACPANFNGVSGVGVQDIFDFLAAWFAGCP